ncbi:hypothetical protein L7F22_058736, partial [Adiantum nelumboides]|nr:hypothetical protein [Adiantum nelumboides]
MVVENTCASAVNATVMNMVVGADIVKEDDYLSTQKQEKKDDVCETTNESLSDSMPCQSVDTVDESQELIAVVNKSQEEHDDIVGKPKS